MGRELDAAVYLNLSGTEIMRQLAGRLICRTCQAPYHMQLHPPTRAGICDLCGGELSGAPTMGQLIRVRLRAFQRVTAPLVKLLPVDGQVHSD